VKAVILGIVLGLLAGLVIGHAKAETGLASFYGGSHHHGHKMANGGIYNQNSDTCAHKHHPFGTRLRVVRAGGGAVVCVVRDRGPFKRGRIVDLSVAHAKALRMIGAGVVRVTAEVVR
jgi:rare lipoprotein A